MTERAPVVVTGNGNAMGLIVAGLVAALVGIGSFFVVTNMAPSQPDPNMSASAAPSPADAPADPLPLDPAAVPAAGN